MQTAARELLRENGRIVGLVTESLGRTTRIAGRRGVVLATGGFPGSSAMRSQWLPHADKHYSMAPQSNQGDGMRLALDAGAVVDEDNIATPSGRRCR
jgi:succinate dehydrogenase/fumarate reductase flavoprotein subunit